MKILSVNAGSSSLKFSLIKLPSEEKISSGLFDRIGLDDSCYTIKYNGNKIREEKIINNHKDAVGLLIKILIDNNIITSLDEIKGIGHRVVHGGEKYRNSIIIDEDVKKSIEVYSELAPLHNPANLIGIEVFMSLIPTAIPVAVFDTAFHQTMSKETYLYPIPYYLYEKYGIRKYGFHGTSHKYINDYITKLLNNKNLKVISCHLGNGSSVAAINSGKVVDTSMGFTPLAGLMMGTRSGDIDPGIIEYIMKKENLDINGVMNILNKKSGLIGISELSSDSRDIEKLALEGNKQAILTEEMCSQKVANYIAMYNNLLNNADVLCFTAGIGENSKIMREKIMNKISSLGIKYDKELNDTRGKFQKISSFDSKIEIYVIPTDEELMIAHDTYELIKEVI